MVWMENKFQEHNEEMMNLNTKVKRLEEDNATLRHDLKEQDETAKKLSTEVNHLKEDNAMLRKELKDTGIGQTAREKTSFTKNIKVYCNVIVHYGLQLNIF